MCVCACVHAGGLRAYVCARVGVSVCMRVCIRMCIHNIRAYVCARESTRV